MPHYVDNNFTPTIASNLLEANTVLLKALWSEGEALRASVMCDNRPSPRLLCTTMPVICDTPRSRVMSAHMRKRGRNQHVILGLKQCN